MATEAVFRSWNTERAHIYRRREKIPHDLGTAVNVCTMVFGNMGETSGTGVCFTRDPSTGRTGVYGDYLVNAQGEDVVAGIRNTLSLADLEHLDKNSYDELRSIMHRLETHYRDLCDIGVHHRARQAVDAPRPAWQAHRCGRLPRGHPAGRREAHHHG